MGINPKRLINQQVHIQKENKNVKKQEHLLLVTYQIINHEKSITCKLNNQNVKIYRIALNRNKLTFLQVQFKEKIIWIHSSFIQNFNYC